MKLNVIKNSSDVAIPNGPNKATSESVHFAAYHEMADVPVTFKTLEEEFMSRLGLVEDLHKRFHFMMSELKSAGLKTED